MADASPSEQPAPRAPRVDTEVPDEAIPSSFAVHDKALGGYKRAPLFRSHINLWGAYLDEALMSLALTIISSVGLVLVFTNSGPANLTDNQGTKLFLGLVFVVFGGRFLFASYRSFSARRRGI